jgi:hypothetical protein
MQECLLVNGISNMPSCLSSATHNAGKLHELFSKLPVSTYPSAPLQTRKYLPGQENYSYSASLYCLDKYDLF